MRSIGYCLLALTFSAIASADVLGPDGSPVTKETYPADPIARPYVMPYGMVGVGLSADIYFHSSPAIGLAVGGGLPGGVQLNGGIRLLTNAGGSSTTIFGLDGTLQLSNVVHLHAYFNYAPASADVPMLMFGGIGLPLVFVPSGSPVRIVLLETVVRGIIGYGWDQVWATLPVSFLWRVVGVFSLEAAVAFHLPLYRPDTLPKLNSYAEGYGGIRLDWTHVTLTAGVDFTTADDSASLSAAVVTRF